ncbi:MAG: response regulator transcription factor [Pseudomonadota bacterium]
MNDVRAVVIDDEALARVNVSRALAAVSSWQLVGEFESAEIARRRLPELQVDVVFLDIKMPGQSGVTFASELQERPNPPLIVFVTAFDDYALQAFELFAFDYLLKPFNNERLRATIDRIEACLAHDESLASIRYSQSRYRQPGQRLDQLIVRSVGSIRIIKIDAVRWFRASGNYVEVGHEDGVHLQRVQLSFLEKHLDPNVFLRIHRSSVVRLSEIREVEPGPDDSGTVILADGSQHAFSSRYKDVLFARLSLD